MTTNNNYFYRSTIFPSQGISIANLEVNHIRNLPKHLQKDPVAFAAQLEENLRQNKTETTAFLLPKNTEYLTLAGCKGLLYTDKNFTDINHSNYVSFYGINNQHAISLRGTFNKGKEQKAREELKRILTEDLIPINK